MIRLYGTPPTRALRPLWLLRELGLAFEMLPVDIPGGETRTPWFLALNPAGKVPVLVDGDLVLTESVAMQFHLAGKCPEAGLIPDAPADRAELYRWTFFLVTEIEQPLWRMARHTFIYPESQRLPREVQIARDECAGMLGVFERHMQAREFVLGDRICVADFNAAYLLDWAGEEGLLAETPHLRGYLARMYARPNAPPRIAAAISGARNR